MIQTAKEDHIKEEPPSPRIATRTEVAIPHSSRDQRRIHVSLVCRVECFDTLDTVSTGSPDQWNLGDLHPWVECQHPDALFWEPLDTRRLNCYHEYKLLLQTMTAGDINRLPTPQTWRDAFGEGVTRQTISHGVDTIVTGAKNQRMST